MEFLKRRHQPGTAPGTLAEIEPSKGPIRARYVEYRPDTIVESVLDRPEELPEATTELTQWMDIEGHDSDLIRKLGKLPPGVARKQPICIGGPCADEKKQVKKKKKQKRKKKKVGCSISPCRVTWPL